jgi:hypothetical protein
MIRIEAQSEREATVRPVGRRRPIRVVAPTASGRRWRHEARARWSEVGTALLVDRSRSATEVAPAA